MMTIGLLLQHLPPWITIEDRQKGVVTMIAAPPMPGGGAYREFYLELRSSPQNGVSVSEQNERRQFPGFCLERHINPNNTFCLYYGSEGLLQDADAANVWWASLGSFLANQVYAERRAVWPLAAGLSHGDAAREQLEMEVLAEPLGWKDDILRSIFRGKGWLAERLPRISKKRDRVTNSRSSCPRGCTHKHKLLRKKSCDLEACNLDCRKQHKPILRRDCPHRSVIEALILHEHQRLAIESRIVDELIAEGKQCCGTMKFCPLQRT